MGVGGGGGSYTGVGGGWGVARMGARVGGGGGGKRQMDLGVVLGGGLRGGWVLGVVCEGGGGDAGGSGELWALRVGGLVGGCRGV